MVKDHSRLVYSAEILEEDIFGLSYTSIHLTHKGVLHPEDLESYMKQLINNHHSLNDKYILKDDLLYLPLAPCSRLIGTELKFY